MGISQVVNYKILNWTGIHGCRFVHSENACVRGPFSKRRSHADWSHRKTHQGASDGRRACRACRSDGNLPPGDQSICRWPQARRSLAETDLGQLRERRVLTEGPGGRHEHQLEQKSLSLNLNCHQGPRSDSYRRLSREPKSVESTATAGSFFQLQIRGPSKPKDLMLVGPH